MVLSLKVESLGEQRPVVTGLQAIELGNGFADVHGYARAGLMERPLHPGKLHGLLTLKRANQQAQGRALGAEYQLAAAHGLGTRYAGQPFQALRRVGGQQGSIDTAGAACGAYIQGRGQHGIQPLHHAASKAGDHHRQGHRQAQAGHHAAHGHGSGVAHAPRALQRQHGQRLARKGVGYQCQYRTQQPGQGRHAAQQQQAHGHIGGQRDTCDRRHKGQHQAGCEQCDSGPQTRSALVRAAQPLERGRRWQIHGGTCGPPGAGQRGCKAQQTEDQRCRRTPVQGGLHAGEESAAQIAAQHLQRQPGQRRTQRNTGQAAQSPQRQRFQQHQCHALARRGSEYGQQRELRRALSHAERQYREHQERSREQGHQRQHREVDAVGARHLAHALLIVAGLLDQYLVLPGRQCVQGGAYLAAAGAVGQQ